RRTVGGRMTSSGTASRSVQTLPLLIGGERRLAADGGTLDAVDPATGRTIARIPRCTTADVGNAVEAAARAFPAWAALHPDQRAAYLYRLAGVVERRAEELALIDVADNGSPIKEMRKDAALAVAWIRHHANLALQVRGETIPTGHARLDYTLRQPFGVVGR